jgi:hypothetical protein
LCFFEGGVFPASGTVFRFGKAIQLWLSTERRLRVYMSRCFPCNTPRYFFYYSEDRYLVTSGEGLKWWCNFSRQIPIVTRKRQFFPSPSALRR